jgi:hypothetical protein
MMIAYARLGQRSQALRVWQRCVVSIQNELAQIQLRIHSRFIARFAIGSIDPYLRARWAILCNSPVTPFYYY